MDIIDIDMNIQVTDNISDLVNKKRTFTGIISNSPRQKPCLLRSFKQALDRIKFCTYSNINITYLSKKYFLTCDIIYPFDFPSNTFKKNFIAAINNSVDKKVTFSLTTIDKAYCLCQRIKIFFENINIIPKNLCVVDKNVHLTYECKQDKYISYSRTLETIFNNVVKSTDWVICKNYHEKNVMLIESLIIFTGFTGKYSINVNTAFITCDSKDEAIKTIDLFDQMLYDYKDKLSKEFYSFFSYGKKEEFNKFLSKYNGIIYKTINHNNKPFQWMITNYKWIERYCNGIYSHISYVYAMLNSIFITVMAEEDTKKYYKQIHYITPITEEVEKILFFIPSLNSYIQVDDKYKNFNGIIYIENPSDMQTMVKKYQNEKESISVVSTRSLKNNFENKIIDESIRQKFKQCKIYVYPYMLLEGDTEVNYNAIIASCGRATLRRAIKQMNVNYTNYKSMFLSSIDDTDQVEVFSQESLQDIPPQDFPYLALFDTHYYDLRELSKHIESSDEPFLPHNRRLLNDEDYKKIADIMNNGHGL